MNIDISKKEYITLLEILRLAGWVLHSHRTKIPKKQKKYIDFEQKIFSHAKDMEFEELVEYAESQDKYFTTRKFEETGPVTKYIEEFQNEVFWEEIVERLVEQDLIRQEGVIRYFGMTDEKRFKKEDPLREKYATEFEANGLSNLTINK